MLDEEVPDAMNTNLLVAPSCPYFLSRRGRCISFTTLDAAVTISSSYYSVHVFACSRCLHPPVSFNVLVRLEHMILENNSPRGHTHGFMFWAHSQSLDEGRMVGREDGGNTANPVLFVPVKKIGRGFGRGVKFSSLTGPA